MHLKSIHGGFPNLGVLFGGPNNKDYSIWALYKDLPILGNYHTLPVLGLIVFIQLLLFFCLGCCSRIKLCFPRLPGLGVIAASGRACCKRLSTLETGRLVKSRSVYLGKKLHET